MLVAVTLFFGLTITKQNKPVYVTTRAEISLVSSVHAQEVSVPAVVVEAPKEAPSISSLPSVPDGDPLATLGKIASDWKTMSPVAWGILLVLLVCQASKHGWIESVFTWFGWQHVLEWKRAIIALTSLAYGGLYMFQGGSPASAILLALISAFGAMGTFESIKGVWYLIVPKKKPAQQLV
jgi:hypothetical protein